jgi:hypothetical protein
VRVRELSDEHDRDALDSDCLEGDVRASRADGVSLCASVDAAPGAHQHRVHATPIRPAPTRDPARLAGRADRRDRHRPGTVRRERRRSRGVPAARRRRRAREGRGRARTRGLPLSAQQRRLAPPVGDLRARRDVDLRRGRSL